MTRPPHTGIDPAMAAAAMEPLVCRNRLLDTDYHYLTARLDRVIYALNYRAYRDQFEPQPSSSDPPDDHGPPDPGVLLRIEILDPVTERAKWIQQWNGFAVATLWAEAPTEPSLTAAESLDAAGGYTWQDEWDEKLHDQHPINIAAEIVLHQRASGFECRFIPPEPAS